MRKLNGLLLLLAVLTCGCYRQDIIVFPVRVPQMKSEACAKMIEDHIYRLEGVQNVDTDVAKRTVIVTYDSKRIARKNVELLIVTIGFDANGLPAKPEARAALPQKYR